MNFAALFRGRWRGSASYVRGSASYDLAIVGVTGSLFPAVSAYLMYRFLGHPLRWWQGVGIAGVLTGTSLIALG